MQFFKIEQNVLMITIHTSKRVEIIVFYNMYTIGLIYSFIYIIQESETHFYTRLEVNYS